ncbi:hypothetical protein Peur_032581 [Populus x canadensis]
MRPAKATIARRMTLHFPKTFLANSPNFVGNIPCCLKKLPSKTMPKPDPFQEVEADEHGFQPQMKRSLIGIGCAVGSPKGYLIRCP